MINTSSQWVHNGQYEFNNQWRSIWVHNGQYEFSMIQYEFPMINTSSQWSIRVLND